MNLPSWPWRRRRVESQHHQPTQLLQGVQMEAREAVANGAARLDQRGPAGWRGKVNPVTLALSNAELCVLGQLYGRYADGRDAIGITSDAEACEFGFYARTLDEYPVLAAEWRKMLAAGEVRAIEPMIAPADRSESMTWAIGAGPECPPSLLGPACVGGDA